MDMLYRACIHRGGPYPAEREKITTAILDEMVNVANQTGAMPIFVYMPVRDEMLASNGRPLEEEFLSEYCGDRNLHYLSLRQSFLARTRSGHKLKTTGHWGAKEHQTAAQAIKGYLESKNLIKSRPKTY
jgi:hypothetical protein